MIQPWRMAAWRGERTKRAVLFLSVEGVILFLLQLVLPSEKFQVRHSSAGTILSTASAVKQNLLPGCCVL